MAGRPSTLSATWSRAGADRRSRVDVGEGRFQALQALARHAAQPGAGGRIPSDLPLGPLDAGRD